jgi:hypothetical protein
MPQLNSERAAVVDKAEGGNFEPIDEGVYVLTLAKEVEAKDGDKGPYWNWTFKVADIPEQEAVKGRLLWQNTSLSETAAWRLKETFEAFGVPTTTHTDELIGKSVKAYVVQRVIDKGTKKGEKTNDIKTLYAMNASTVDGPVGATPSAAPADAVPLY